MSPPVNIERSAGWSYPDRATSTGTVLYQRRLEPDGCTDVSWNPEGNGLFILLDPTTGRADVGVGAWRDPGGPLLNVAPDGRNAHDLDVRFGDGVAGYGRAAQLPPLGGLLRRGELNGRIPHAVAINVDAARLSGTKHFVWPASSADASAAGTYRGPDPNYAMGALLAIPRSTRLGRLAWQTPQGRHLALAAQRYGYYIVDSHLSDHLVQFAMETNAARQDLGLIIDPATGRQAIDPARFDSAGFDLDVAQIFTLLRAVTSNAPAS